MTPPLDATEGPDDWITAPRPGAAPAATATPAPAGTGTITEGPDDWITAPHQNMVDAAGNAAFQGLVSGTGSAIAGAGRQFTRAATQGTQQQLAVMDRVDRGDVVPDQDDPLGYQYLAAEQRAKARADLAGAATEQAKHEPNALERAGGALQKAAPIWYPVEPQAEGHVTNVARMLGGMVPAIGAGAVGTAVGGPVGGVLGTASLIGAQSYDETYQEAIANGATHEQADDAAGKAAMAQMATMSLPVGRVLPLIPVSQRVGFLKTVINLAQRGVELSGGNELATLAQNYVASQTYDPARSLFKGSGDNALDSFLTGLIIHGAGKPFAAMSRPDPAAVADRVMGAPTVDAAINAATDAAGAQGGGTGGGAPPGTGAPQPSFGDLFNREPPRAAEVPAENAAAAPEVANGWRRRAPDEPLMPGQEVATDAEGRQYVRDRPAQAEAEEAPVEEEPDVLTAPAPQAVGAKPTNEPFMPGHVAPGDPSVAETIEPVPAKTRGQALRDLRSDVKQSAEDRAQPFTDPATGVVGLQDHEAYAPGVPGRMLADRELTPRNAGDHKLFYGTDPVYRASAEAIDRERNMAMVDLLARDVQDDDALEKAHKFRNEANPNQMGVFANEREVSDQAQALVDKIDRMLDSSAGKEPGVQRVLNLVRTALHDRRGNIETLPSQIYGARRVLTTLLQKGVRGTTELADDVRSARHELTSLIEPDDGIGFNETITTGAPRFREFLSEWANRSLPINQMEYLQSRNHTNLDGYLELRKVQATLDDILKQRRATGNQKAKTLTEQQIENLVAVRNELAARNLRDRMAKMPGSDTTQLMSNAAKWGEGPLGKGIKFAAEGGAHLLAAHTTGGVGNAALFGARYMYDKRAEKVARAAEAAQAAKIAARKRELLGQGAALPALPLAP